MHYNDSMQWSQTKIIIIFILVSSIIFGSAFLLPSKLTIKIGSGMDIVGALSSLVTLLIALLLYKKFGVERSFLDNQMKTVGLLLKELKKPLILVEQVKIGSMIQFLPNEASDYLTHNPSDYFNYEDIKLVFGESYFLGTEKIASISENAFLPKKIAAAVRKILPLVIDGNEKYSPDDQVYEARYPGYREKDKDKKVTGLLNRKKISLVEYAVLWNKIIKEIELWLKANSDIPTELNLKREW